VEEVTGTPGSVAQLSKQLAATSTSSTAAAPAAKASSGAAAAAAGASGRVSPSLTEHDTKNTANASVLLATGSFRLQPGKDTLEYDALLGMRLEDGIDVTRKVRPAQPAWARRQAECNSRTWYPDLQLPWGASQTCPGGPSSECLPGLLPACASFHLYLSIFTGSSCCRLLGMLWPASLFQACRRSWFACMQEEYLSAAAFEKVFGMSKEAFAAMPAWKRLDAKKKHGLF
jgi:hypothetical protein